MTTKIKTTKVNESVTKSKEVISDHYEINDIVYINSDIFDKNCFEQDGEKSPYIYSGIPKSKFKELIDKPLHIKKIHEENKSYWYDLNESIYTFPQCYLKIYQDEK